MTCKQSKITPILVSEAPYYLNNCTACSGGLAIPCSVYGLGSSTSQVGCTTCYATAGLSAWPQVTQQRLQMGGLHIPADMPQRPLWLLVC